MSKYEVVPVPEALAIVRSATPVLGTETVPTAEADGRVLAEDLTSAEDVPPFRASTVDGFAIIAGDGLQPRRVTDEIMAGVANRPTIGPGTAARIMTGAPVPPGADAVVMIEYTHVDDGQLTLDRRAREGENVRPIGIDITAGAPVLERGTIIGIAEVGILMTLGIAQVACYRRPLVGVLSTGDELVEPWEPVPAGAIRDSNRYALMAAVREAGALPMSLGTVKDDRELQTQRVREGVAQVDVLLTSGGVSVGDRDFIKLALEEIGKVHFGRIAFRPGLPLTFAQIGHKLAFGLPGNPVSSLVTFEVFVRPTLRVLQGDPQPDRARVEVELAHEIRRGGDRLEYHRVIVSFEGGRLVARSTGLQISSRLLSMSGHNGLAIVETGDGLLPAGTRIPAILTGPIQGLA
jgi:molybdopterin molybdotransferase